MTRKTGFGILVLALAATAALAAPADRWLHVKVEDGEEGETVRVNLPLGLVETILPLIRCEELKEGKVNLARWIPEEIEVRGILEALRNTEDAEFVTVEGRDESVRIVKSGDFLLVHVEEKDGEERVDVKFPMKVVDALLSGEGDELDIAAAVQALGEHPDGDLITVRDGSDHVRVWIDSQNTSK